MKDKSSSNSNIVRNQKTDLNILKENNEQKSSIIKYEKLSSALKENIKRRKNAINNKK